jgi:transposase InsO family protein
VIRALVHDYNEVRPHLRIGRMPPRRFASKLAMQIYLKPQPPTPLPCNPAFFRNDWYGGKGQVKHLLGAYYAGLGYGLSRLAR